MEHLPTLAGIKIYDKGTCATFAKSARSGLPLADDLPRVRALLRELPDDREAAGLGIAACMQLLNVSWRVGTGLDEARALLEEGQRLASAIDDPSEDFRFAIA